MNNLEAALDIATQETPDKAWGDYIRKAVLQFLKTAVVVDNDPGDIKSNEGEAYSAAPPTDNGMDSEGYVATPPETDPQSKNVLEIRKISDSFSEQGLACAFVLPEEGQEEEKVRQRVVSAAKTADILVIDWHLRAGTPSLTLKLLREIAESDLKENGRMRLICIYTGEALDQRILDQAVEQLTIGSVRFSERNNLGSFPYCSRSQSSLLVLANKEDVPADALPLQLIDIFAELANGLVPAFALAAVGAIRKNTHHMLTRFSQNLDSAYIANRLITNPPGDVAELMRELLVAECDNAIGLESVADQFLEPEPIKLWLDKFGFREFDYEVESTSFKCDRAALNGLLAYGINDHGITINGNEKRKFPEKHRGEISKGLAAKAEDFHHAENDFSRLVTFRREAFGNSTNYMAENWLPSLTTGTLLRLTKGANVTYHLCFTPACDMLRLSSTRPFVFLTGRKKEKPYNLVVLEETGPTGLYFDKNYPEVSTFSFKPDPKLKRVRSASTRDEGGVRKFVFTPEEEIGGELVWLGEVRYGRSMSEVAALAGRWMRVGILDSEYLRLASKKTFPFKA